jgi:hypothetical protein
VFGNAFVLILLANHKASYVLQKNEGYFSLGAYLNEVSTFLGALTEQNTIICYNSHLLIVYFSETCQQCGPILFLVFLKLWTIQYSPQNISTIKCLSVIRWNNVVELLYVVKRFFDIWKINIDFRSIQLRV